VGTRDKKRYPYLTSEYDNAEIANAVKKAGTIKGAAEKLGVNDRCLYAAIRRRGIEVNTKTGRRSIHDWEAIEKAWRNRPEGTFAARFAREFGMNSATFYAGAQRRGFYNAPPIPAPASETPRPKLVPSRIKPEPKAGKGGPAICSVCARLIADVFKEERTRVDAIAGMSPIDRAKALAALARIKNERTLGSLIREEMRKNATALTAAGASRSTKTGAA